MSIARSNSLSQSSSGIPLLVTTITSGTGTFTPQAATKWCKVTVVGAGGAGGAGGNVGGNYSNYTAGYGGPGANGAFGSFWIARATNYTYAVGAAGIAGVIASNGYPTTSTAGGTTTFSSLTSSGGKAGVIGSTASTSSSAAWPIPVIAASSPYGVGGDTSTAAIGYGTGGGPGYPNGVGTNGSSGLLIIEEY
jgi:hypothetical protein